MSAVPAFWVSWDELLSLGGVAPHRFARGEERDGDAIEVVRAHVRGGGRIRASYCKRTNLVIFAEPLAPRLDPSQVCNCPRVHSIPDPLRDCAHRLLGVIEGRPMVACSRLGCARKVSLGAAPRLCGVCRFAAVSAPGLGWASP